MEAKADPKTWRQCNSCRKPIAYLSKYWVCNVSTCNRKRIGFVFCDVSCWDAHIPMMNHRESWAEERKAPSREEWQKVLSGEDRPKRTRTKKEKPVSVDEPEVSPAPAAPQVILRRSRSTD